MLESGLLAELVVAAATYLVVFQNEVFTRLGNDRSEAHSEWLTPTPKELEHDFLWRVHAAVAAKGDVAIFNRSHYEDVLIARVMKLVPEAVWKRRYEAINGFEQLLVDNGVVIVKFFLHISKAEQKQRLARRLEDATRQWKVAPEDFEQRKHWNQYMRAYEDAIDRCNAKGAPWYVVPADKKWFRNLAVSEILVATLEGLHMRLPQPTVDLANIKLD